ncbi:MAG: hypothetical protein V8T86_18060 [Victivallis sp.]
MSAATSSRSTLRPAARIPPFSPGYENAPNLLELRFDDVADPVREAGGVFMSEADGDAVLAFVKRMDRTRQLYVHCTAGITRSGAVGEVIDWFVNCCLEKNHEDHAMFLRRHPYLVPNRWCAHSAREVPLPLAVRHAGLNAVTGTGAGR